MGYGPGQLQIYKKDESGPRRALLTAERWQQLTAGSSSHPVTTVVIIWVYLQDCPQVWLEIAQNTEITRLGLYSVCDDTDGTEISQGLGAALPNLVNLKRFDLRDIFLGESRKVVITSINAPKLRMLSLSGTDLSGSGGALVDCLTNLQILKYLNLNFCNLFADEMQKVVYSLPKCCPLLASLLLKGNNLSTTKLYTVVQQLHNLKILNIGRCIVNEKEILKTADNTPLGIQILDIASIIGDEGVLEEVAFCSLLKTRTSMKYLCVSENQISSDGSMKIEDILAQRKGHLIVKGNNNPLMEEYTSYYNKIAADCVEDLI